jgi:rRNA maturation endonuclease Nob1
MHIMNELETDFTKNEQKSTRKASTLTAIHGNRCPICRKIVKTQESHSYCAACGWKGKKTPSS